MSTGNERFARLMLSYPALWNRAREELLVQVNRLSAVQLTMSDLKRKIRTFCNNRRRKINRWEHGIVSDPSQCNEARLQYSQLSHASKCLGHELSEEFNGEVCLLTYCQPMKDLLKHIATCQATELCTTPKCTSMKNILNHFKNCRKEICPLCSPEKKWYKTITTVQRNHIVDILLENISSNTISPIICDLLAYTKKKESNTFKAVKSGSDYYRALSYMLSEIEVQKKVQVQYPELLGA